MFLRQSTSQIIRFGPFLDSTDGVTPETALTIAQADMQLSKDGGAFAQKNAAGNATHDTDGWYSTTLNTTDTATAGELKIQVNVAGALPVWEKWFVLTATAYDSLQTGTFNNVAATDIVSAGAITTLSGAIVNVDLVDTLTTYTGNTPQTADHTAGIADIPTVAEFNARTLVAANYFDAATDTVANVTLVATTTTNTDMVGTNGANTVVPPSVAQFNARTIVSADYFLVTDYTAPDNAGITANSVAIAALNDISVSDIFTTQMIESYSADGIAPTLAQSLFLTMQNLQDYAYVGTTQTVRKIDGSTTAATYTLDDATNPTAKTRAS